jgi:hypothetical protein
VQVFEALTTESSKLSTMADWDTLCPEEGNISTGNEGLCDLYNVSECDSLRYCKMGDVSWQKFLVVR